MPNLDPRPVLEAAFPHLTRELGELDVLKFPLPRNESGPRSAFDFPLASRDQTDAEEDSPDDYDDAFSLEELHKIAEDPELGPTVEEGGTDVLACYMPWSLGGPGRWGIVWNEPAMFRALIRLILKAELKCSEVTLDMVAQCLRRVVRQHELFHFTVEYAAAHLSLQHGRDCYRPNFKHPARSEWEERLATAWEMEWLASRKPSKLLPAPALNAIRDAWRETPRPHPYSQWKDAAGSRWQAAAEAHAAVLCGIPAAGRLYRDLVHLAPQNPASSVVPEYSFGLQRVLALHDSR